MRSASREGTKEAGASQWPLQALSGGPRKPSADRSCATHGSLPPKRRWRCLETCMFAARAGGWRCRATCLTGQSPENKDYDLNANSPVVEKRPPPSESPFLSVEFTDSDSGDLQLQGSVVEGAPPWSKPSLWAPSLCKETDPQINQPEVICQADHPAAQLQASHQHHTSDLSWQGLPR